MTKMRASWSLLQSSSRSYYCYLRKSCHRRRLRCRPFFSTKANTGYNKKRFRLDETDGLLYDTTTTTKKPIYQVIIGLEVHAQLDIPTKLFSNAPYPYHNTANPTAKPNSNLHPFDVAVPGYLPVISGEAVRAAIVAASALNCAVRPTSRFERKHYAYADLPFGYQITQQRWPLAVNGEVEFASDNKEKKSKGSIASSCRIERIQLEQDTGKTIVSGDVSRVDFDRAGCALIEIVTAPDLRSPKQASCLVKHLRNLLQHLGVCKGRMQDGHLRVDANVNLQRLISQREEEENTENNDPTRGWRTPRVEVKNLNSIQQVAAATTYEALRQASVFDNINMNDVTAESVIRKNYPEETRTWNASTSSTVLIRKKDQEDDYRFLPEPDLPPLVLQDFISQYGQYSSLDEFLKANMPERPEVIVDRLQKGYGYSDSQASVLAQHGDPSALRLLEDVLGLLVVSEEEEEVKGTTTTTTTATSTTPLQQKKQQQKQKQQYAKIAYNLLVNELFALVKECAGDDQEPSLEEHNTVTADQMAVLVQMSVEGSISKTQSKKLLQLLFREYVGEDPRWVASECNLTLLSDPVELREVCRRVLADNPEEVAKYQRGGKFAVKMRKFLTGQAMAVTDYNAHPERLQEALAEVLEEVEAGVPSPGK